MIKEKLNCLKVWINENKIPIYIVFSMYSVLLYTIGVVQYPYIDDNARQITGATNFWIHYSRFISEIVSWFLQGSRHLTDQGVSNFLISGVILSVASLIAMKVIFVEKKIPIIAAIISVFIGVNPWFLECLSFRFDSPFMSLSVFFGIFPYLFWNASKKIFYVISTISVLLLCNTYQASSGIFIIFAICLFFLEIIENRRIFDNINKAIIAAAAFVSGMILYLFEMRLNPELATRGNIVAIAKFRDLPSTLIKNTISYFNVIYNDSAKIWIVIMFILTILCLFIFTKNAKINKLFAFVLTLIYFFIGFVFSYGVLLIFKDSLVAQSGRYGGYGFSVFVALTLISVLKFNDSKIFNIFLRFSIILFMYFQIEFDFGYSSMLAAQKNSFEIQSQILASDLKNVLTPERKNVYANKFLKSSPILLNSERNFPILRKLVPMNENLYWPNQYWFNNLTGMYIELNPIPFDFSTFDENGEGISKVAENFYYTIYVNQNQIFINMK
ncbi:MAG TPA: glucosyltransferase domain-containing protein [Enterococcus cecorum]|nr:glucosyltransferase domain-containing protein [Enterococcus cecorum]